MRASKRIWRSALLWLLLTPAAATAPPTASEVKAVYLFNFVSFVEWPAAAFKEADATFDICVLRDASLSRALEGIVAGESVGGRSLVARRIARALEAPECQIVFVGRTEELRTPGVLAAVASKPVLTVGEAETFARHGGMISFVLEQGTVRFTINVDAVARSGLTMSSKLIQLARGAPEQDD
ncbi:MAG: YfiR family protein [Myxococcota bacterium]